MSRFLGYAWLPVVSAATWFGVLLAMLIIWGAEGTPRYQPDEGGIVYISDVGAHIKPLFIAGTSVTGPFFVAALIAERWLRHRSRLTPNRRTTEKVLSVCAIVCALVGAAALICLSIWDAFNHSSVHWRLTVVFIIFIALSAIFTTCEFRFLRKGYPDTRRLMLSYAAKILIVIFAVALAIAMGVLMNKNHESAAAVCEWIIAFLFDAYVWTLVYDLRPAVKTSNRYLKRHPSAVMAMQEQQSNGWYSGQASGGPDLAPNNHTINPVA
ncbi:hypothetical protein YB2330_003819 [Saitoella coloradoensis]